MMEMELLAREMAMDLLWMERQLHETYGRTKLACVHDELHGELGACCHEVGRIAVKLQEEMLQRGWVRTHVAGRQAIEGAAIWWEQQLERHPELDLRPRD